ncbi:MAG: SDR family oxidoreductase [Lachnospiraceae bacterium]|nr:SDR family oxidoreductase [Lachnospiraceae bacterium]
MKILLIGGTGTISLAISQRLQELGHTLTLFNRGKSKAFVPVGAELICGDIQNEAEIAKLLQGRKFDVVANFIAFEVTDVQRDFRLFQEITDQYIFISSASAYQKPAVSPFITESTPLSNPYWVYSRKKIACEEWLMERFREDKFPITIVRPSHTYGNTKVPLALSGHKGSWPVVRRIMDGKPVLIHGDGSSLWTLTHNTDFAKGFIGLLGNCHAIGQAVHITSDESLTWTQIHEIIAQKVGGKLVPCYVPSDTIIKVGKRFGYDYEGGLMGDKATTVIFDNSKLKKLVPDFVATTRFDLGIADTIEHILKNPQYQTEDKDYEEFTVYLHQKMQEMEGKLA